MAKRLASAERIARAAGALLRERLGKHVAVHSKEVRRDLVTESDTQSEALIKSALAEAHPGDAYLGEETGASGDATKHGRWIVDPLDGTTNYAHGYRCFSVSIGFECEGRVQLGVVYDPMADELFRARRGAGANRNGEALHVSGTRELIDALLVTGFAPQRADGPLTNLQAFADFMRRAQAIRRDGSAALDLCYVAAGRLDGFWETGLHAWDVAAGSLIVEEAGGRVTDYRGEPLRLDGGHIVASNGLIHAAMLETLRAYAQETV